jgi:hypothetical protein
MAYIFPINPTDGQLYPVPAIPGALQYQWNQEYNAWFIFSPLGVQSVTGILPIIVSDGTDNAVISIAPATINNAGSMSSADKTKLDAIPADANSGTVTQILTGSGLTGGPITQTGTIDLEPATTTTEGGVIIGANIDVSPNGTISIPTARFGVTSINVGPGLVGAPSPIISTGTISAALATRLSVGAVRVGAGIAIAPDGTISVDGSLAKANILAYASVGVAQGASPPVFTVLESYNVSAITWAGTAENPRVRVTYQVPLANANYGIATGAQSSQNLPTVIGPTPQRNQNITMSTRDVAFLELQLSTNTVGTWTTGFGNNVIWNDWGNTFNPGSNGPAGITMFDIAVIDTPVF